MLPCVFLYVVVYKRMVSQMAVSGKGARGEGGGEGKIEKRGEGDYTSLGGGTRSKRVKFSASRSMMKGIRSRAFKGGCA